MCCIVECKQMFWLFEHFKCYRKHVFHLLSLKVSHAQRCSHRWCWIIEWRTRRWCYCYVLLFWRKSSLPVILLQNLRAWRNFLKDWQLEALSFGGGREISRCARDAITTPISSWFTGFNLVLLRESLQEGHSAWSSEESTGVWKWSGRLKQSKRRRQTCTFDGCWGWSPAAGHSSGQPERGEGARGGCRERGS